MNNWISMELGQIASIYNGSTPSTNNEEYWNGDIIWITPKDLSNQNQKYILKGERTITQKALSNTKLLPKGTVLLSSRAPIGLLSISTTELVTNQGFKNIVVKADILHNEFLYYYLKLKRNELNNLGSGTTFKELSKSTLEKYKIKLPDLSTQKSIAKVLSDLDAKIELNNRINRELEAMAKTLYDYWFVQFDFPVDDNFSPSGEMSEGQRGYKSSGGKMVYNKELKREIPEGWEVKKLGNVESNIKTGKTPSTTVIENFGGTIPFITIDDIRGQLFILSTERTLSKKGADTQPTKYLKKGDICVSCIGTIGVIGIVNQISQTNQQINSISIQDSDNRFFLLNALKNYFEFNVAAKKGAVLLNMNKAEFSDIPILDSDSSVKEKFNKIVEPMYNNVETNLLQNQQLSELRDWLLPMLMNGQVTVKEDVAI